MSRAIVLVIFVGVSLLLPGCTQGSDQTRAASAPAATNASGPSGTECLKGLVTDPELLPIARAQVRLRPGDARLETGADGAFSFCGIEAGRFQLNVGARGYESWMRVVDVPVSAENLSVVLKPLPLLEPHHVMVPKVVYYTWGLTTADTTTSRYGVDLANCSPCTWTELAQQMPDFLLHEADWVRKPMPPSGVTDQMWHIVRGGTPFASATDIGSSYVAKKSAITYTRDDMSKNPNVQASENGVPLSGSMYCGGSPIDFPCADQRINVYLTFFYDHDGVPADYSAIPT